MNRSNLLLFTVPFILLVYATLKAQSSYIFDFENYNSNQQLVCQDSINWATWYNQPCGDEDPYISTNHSFTATNSLLILYEDDPVKKFGNLNYGKWFIDFQLYIPSGKTGYFTILAVFDGINSNWAMDCIFDYGGSAFISAGHGYSDNFTWIENSWQRVQVIINLDSDNAEFWYADTLIHDWEWSLGIFGQGSPLQLAAINFYGYFHNEMYLDDFRFHDDCLSCYLINSPSNLTSQIIAKPNLHVMLNWQDNSDNEYAFNIIRKNGFPNSPAIYQSIGTASSNVNEFIDSTVIKDSTYTYGVIAYNAYGYSDTSNLATITVDPVTNVGEKFIPLKFDITQNYPNPFNPSTNINFSIPESGNVRLAVYNLVGEEVAVLVDGFRTAGFYEATFDASDLPSGMYIYKLQSANSVQTKKMMLLK